MAFDGSGTFNPPSGFDLSNGTTADGPEVEGAFTEVFTGLSTAICKDGQTTITANLPMAGYRHTGVGNPSARNQYASVAGVQDGTYQYLTSVAGTNTITATGTLSLAAYAAGQLFWFVPANTNTGATTINVNAIGAKNIYRNGAACEGGEIMAGVPTALVYDGTQFHIVSHVRPHVVQSVEATPYTSYSSNSTNWAAADNIMQNDEGLEVLTASIVPTSTTNRLVIEAVVHFSPSTTTSCVAGLFQDSEADALSMAFHGSGITDDLQTVSFRHEMEAGTTSATTFKVRAASAAGSVIMNGITAGRRGGGTLACRLRVTEVLS